MSQASFFFSPLWSSIVFRSAAKTASSVWASEAGIRILNVLLFGNIWNRWETQRNIHHQKISEKLLRNSQLISFSFLGTELLENREFLSRILWVMHEVRKRTWQPILNLISIHPLEKKSQPTKWLIDFPLQSSSRAIEPHKILQKPTANQCCSRKTLDSILKKFQSKLACFSEFSAEKKLDSPGWLKGW